MQLANRKQARYTQKGRTLVHIVIAYLAGRKKHRQTNMPWKLSSLTALAVWLFCTLVESCWKVLDEAAAAEAQKVQAEHHQTQCNRLLLKHEFYCFFLQLHITAYLWPGWCSRLLGTDLCNSLHPSGLFVFSHVPMFQLRHGVCGEMSFFRSLSGGFKWQHVMEFMEGGHFPQIHHFAKSQIIFQERWITSDMIHHS